MKGLTLLAVAMGLVMSLASVTAQAYLSTSAQVAMLVAGLSLLILGIRLRRAPESSPKKLEGKPAPYAPPVLATGRAFARLKQDTIAKQSLTWLLEDSQTSTGVLYLFDGSRLNPAHSTGTEGELPPVFPAQGPIGEAFTQSKVVSIHRGGGLSIFSGLGTNAPPHSLYIPIINASAPKSPRGVITLAGNHPFDDKLIEHLREQAQILGTLALWEGQQPGAKQKLIEAESALKRRDEILRQTQGELHTWESKCTDLNDRCLQLENRVEDLKKVKSSDNPLTTEVLEELAELKSNLAESRNLLKAESEENVRLQQRLDYKLATSQGTEELNNYVESLESRLETQQKQLEDSKHKELGYKEAFNRARRENLALQKQVREKIPEGNKLQQEYAELQGRSHRLAQLSERRATELEALRAALEAEKGKAQQLLDKQAHSLKQKITALQGDVSKLSKEKDTLEGELKHHKTYATDLRHESAAINTGRSALQRQVDELVSERTNLLNQVDELHGALQAWQNAVEQRDGLIADLQSAELLVSAGAIHQDGQVLPILEALSLPALHISGDGIVAGVTRQLSELLQLASDQIVGTDEWSFTTEILIPRAEDAATLRSIQASLLDGAKPGQTDIVHLSGQPPMHRWLVPLGSSADDGRLEIYAPLNSQPRGTLNSGSPTQATLQTIQGLLNRLESVRVRPSGEAIPSPSTTLQALLRQLDEMGEFLPPAEEQNVELRARVSTARALIGNLLNRNDLGQYASRAAVAEQRGEVTMQLAEQLRALETHLLS